MAKGEGTRRVQFTLPSSLVDAIDAYCEKTMMSRSTFVEYTLANTISATDRLMTEIVGSVTDSMAGEMAAQESE